jgi:D-3-phosphoglycerate dehydrogenase / 2-oxoglutarate reductase
MTKDKYFIIDFDSTFTQVEALDELGELTLQDDEQKEQILTEIKNITNSAMDGKSSFTEGLSRRLSLLKANKKHLPQLIARLQTKVSESIKRNTEFFQEYADNIFIVSSGFKEFITPHRNQVRH